MLACNFESIVHLHTVIISFVFIFGVLIHLFIILNIIIRSISNFRQGVSCIYKVVIETLL